MKIRNFQITHSQYVKLACKYKNSIQGVKFPIFYICIKTDPFHKDNLF